MQTTDLMHTGFDISRDQLSLRYVPAFLNQSAADALLGQLIDETRWQQPKIKIYGKWHRTPRLLSFYADSGVNYKYSNAVQSVQAWTPALLAIKSKIEQFTEVRYNSVLLNYYRDGQDTMGWHADDEAELGEKPIIASLSLGAARDFHLKPKKRDDKNNDRGNARGNPRGGDKRFKLNLGAGDLLIMQGETQQAWLHHIPRRANCQAPRVNLTFRLLF